MRIKAEYKNICFFCKGEIKSKADYSLEHIIPNQLLRNSKIQNSTLHGSHSSTYSRVKVPAHRTCNNEFGSRYEMRVLEILEDIDTLYKDIIEDTEVREFISGGDDSSVGIISVWLCKIYFGLFYNDFIQERDLKDDSYHREVINDTHFDMIRRSYRDGHAFMLPSSLYAFKVENECFDLKTVALADVIMLKYKTIILVLCVGDGHLTKNYLQGESLEELIRFVSKLEAEHAFLPQNFICAEISALRMCIRQKPSFVISENQIVNMSMMTLADYSSDYYQVNGDEVASLRSELLSHW